MSSPAIPIGIDFGSVFSCVGIWQQNKVEIISNDEGNKLTPSCVAFTSVGRLVGDAAKNQLDENPQNTISSVTSLLGRRFNDPKIVKNLRNQSFNVVNDNGRPKIQVEWKEETKYFAPEEIGAIVLSALKRNSENYQGSLVKDTVISVPAYFNSSQRKAIKDAVTIAGLNVLRIISKSISAALAFTFFDKNVMGKKNVLIFDLGSEATEVSIVSISGGCLEIKAIAFDQGFGGREFDNRLVKHFTNEFKRKFKIDLKSHSVYKLLSAAQHAKHTLSSNMEVEIDTVLENVNFCTKVSQSKFEDICSDLFSKTLVLVKKALNDANLVPSSIDDIVLVGGSTRIPKIQKLLQNFFCNKTLNFPTDPELTVAYGAAIFAGILSKGASVGPKIHIGPTISLVDVTPFTLSIGIAEKEISKLINRNTKLPCKKIHSFTTETECQSTITVNMYEGERAVSTKNDLLCTFQITQIPSAPAGFPKIDVTLSLDINGILEITAEENSFCMSIPLRVVICNNIELSEEEVNKMAEDEAERCKEENYGIGLQQNKQKGIKRRLSD